MTALHLFTQISKQPRHADEWEGILRSHTGMPMSQQTGHVDVKRLKHEETCTLDTLEQRYIYIYVRVYIPIYIYMYICVLLDSGHPQLRAMCHLCAQPVLRCDEHGQDY